MAKKRQFSAERDAFWLWIADRIKNGGCTQDELRTASGWSDRSIRRGLARARAIRAAELKGTEAEIGRLELYLGPNQQGPGVKPSTCQHPRRITERGGGSTCLDCDTSGLDHLTDFDKSKFAAPPPDRKPRAAKRWRVTMADAKTFVVKATSKDNAKIHARITLNAVRLPPGTRIVELT